MSAPMLTKVDDKLVAPDVLWWPAMNFNQFRWRGTLGRYGLVLPRADFIQRLSDAYARCVGELREDEQLNHDQDNSPLRDIEYPSLDAVLDDAEALFELVRAFIYEDVFEAFLSHPPSNEARFMINSVDEVWANEDGVRIEGRGYHGSPGFCE